MSVGRGSILLACACLAGCTQYWAKPGGTKAEFEGTKAACEGRAYSQFPPMMQQVQLTSGYTTPLQSICTPIGYSVSCYTTGGQYVPPAFMNIDQNETGRTAALRSCLYQAGWQPAKDREEAEMITNSGSRGVTTTNAEWQAGWDDSRKMCTGEANAGSSAIPFANGFDICMKRHGY
jgi:hypothetical protein